MKATSQSIIKIFDIGIKFLSRVEWCQRSFSLTKTGRKVPSYSPEAAVFCAFSSLEQGLREKKVSENDIIRCMDIASDVFMEEFVYDLCVYNDAPGMTKEKVIEAFIKIKNKYERIAK